MIKKYQMVCKHCGALLFKTDEVILSILTFEMKCPNPKCPRKIIQSREDMAMKLLEEKVVGLEARA